MKNYEIKAEFIVEKIITVAAKNEDEAIKEFEKGNWIDENEIQLLDWERMGEPKEV